MTEEDIIKLIRTGGKAMDAGVKALHFTKGPQMLRKLVYMGASSDDAKDIWQETFIKIVRSATTYNGSSQAIYWMNSILKNCYLDHYRKKQSLAKVVAVIDFEDLEMMADPNEENYAEPGSVVECVSAGLERFKQREPERERALRMQMAGLAHQEIGLQIGRTTAATKEYLSQCRKKIQPFIAHCTELLSS